MLADPPPGPPTAEVCVIELVGVSGVVTVEGNWLLELKQLSRVALWLILWDGRGLCVT